jgi:putative tricarboxylic transport membrane protein
VVSGFATRTRSRKASVSRKRLSVCGDDLEQEASVADNEEPMTDHTQGAEGTGPSHRSVEIGVALCMIAFGALVMYGSYRVGIGWGPEGPKAGFFPFYVGLLIVVASALNMMQALLATTSAKLFARWSELGQVMSVVIPTAVYVGVIPFVGLYAASFVLIAVFMKWLGRYPLGLTLAVPAGVVVAVYLMFEKWFLVPLPKGPIEEFLGL